MITAPDREPEEKEIEEISDAALYRHLIVNHVSLRDHYAAAALIGIVSNRGHAGGGAMKEAFLIADAMIAERDRK